MEQEKPQHEPIPLVKSWKQFYMLLLAWLLILIVLMYGFTIYFK
jgi:hypothetical protein